MHQEGKVGRGHLGGETFCAKAGRQEGGLSIQERQGTCLGGCGGADGMVGGVMTVRLSC